MQSTQKDFKLFKALPRNSSVPPQAANAPSRPDEGDPAVSQLQRKPGQRQDPWTNIPSDRFVLSAGSVLFRSSPSDTRLQICIIHNTHSRTPNTYILPKGRKDQGESMAQTAVRETFEETGYPCTLFPCSMPTRAPASGMNLNPYDVLQEQECVEPFNITVRELRDGSMKLVWWYVTWLRDDSAEKVEGVSMPSEEGYVSEFVDVDRALEVFEGTMFHEIVAKAVQLVTKTLEDSEPSSIQRSSIEEQ